MNLIWSTEKNFAEVTANAVRTSWEMGYNGHCREWFLDITGEKIAVQDYVNDQPFHCYVVTY